MRKEDMLKKIEAGESPVNISIEKYRELQCKVLDDEEITIDDIQGTTCALCHVYGDDWTCLTCPLHLANHGCRLVKSTWRNLSKVLNDFTSTKQQILNAMDDMISDLKDAKLYEESTETPRETEKDIYIKEQRECGLKIGDTVRVTRRAADHEKGWGNSWKDEMFAGKTGKITRIGGICDEDIGIAVEIDDDWFYYPYFVLEKVTVKVYAEILIANEKWHPSLHTLKDIKDAEYIELATTTLDYIYYVNLKFHSIYRIKNEE